jgi:superfamily II DNA/RNA helicase
VAKGISHHLKLRCRIVSGGEGKKTQAKEILSQPVDILMATPGRILQHNSTRTLKSPYLVISSCPFIDSLYFSKTKMIVLDEADTLLVKDFKDDLDKLFTPLKVIIVCGGWS